jgi:Resolvase, N terminal domain
VKRVAICIRVSTSKQDTDNQRRELEAVAERSGWKVVKVYEDAGISGAKGRDQRPGLDAMMKAVNAKEFDMVASWSVDIGLVDHLPTCSAFSKAFMKRASVYSFISKDSIRRPLRARRCFKCLAYSLSSSGGSFENELMLGLLARAPMA